MRWHAGIMKTASCIVPRGRHSGILCAGGGILEYVCPPEGAFNSGIPSDGEGIQECCPGRYSGVSSAGGAAQEHFPKLRHRRALCRGVTHEAGATGVICEAAL